MITTTHTFTATAEVVRYLGADVKLVDIDPATLCIDPDAVEAAITPRTKAIDPGALRRPGRRHAGDPRRSRAATACSVVEDAAHALPTTCGGRLVGTLDSDATVFSFYANKTITTGEGGMVVTRDAELARAHADDAPARHEPRRLRPLHGEGAELVLRDRRARASSTT